MKFMNLKRFGSIAMAGALALSLAAPAFAATNDTTTITGAYADTPIAVTVPTTGTAKINPYGLPVKLAKSDDTTKTISGEQINHEVLAVRNNGDVALDLSIKSFYVIPKGGEVAIKASKDGDKGMQVDLQVAGLNDQKYAVASDDDGLADKLIDAFADIATWAGAASVTAPAAAATATSVATPATLSNAVTLGAATVTEDAVTYGKDSIALFRLKGDMAEEPSTSGTDNPWEATDGFEAKVVFKFTPAAPSAGDAAVTVAIFGTTATATYNAGTSGLTAVSYAWTSATTAVATVPATTGATNTATITQAAGATTGQTSVITVTVTLSNGASVTNTATYSAT